MMNAQHENTAALGTGSFELSSKETENFRVWAQAVTSLFFHSELQVHSAPFRAPSRSIQMHSGALTRSAPAETGYKLYSVYIVNRHFGFSEEHFSKVESLKLQMLVNTKCSFAKPCVVKLGQL